MAILKIAQQPLFLVTGIGQCLAEGAFRQKILVIFIFRPGEKLFCDRLCLLLPSVVALLGRKPLPFVLFFKRKQLIAQRQAPVGKMKRTHIFRYNF
jgi:hypothetical protein